MYLEASVIAYVYSSLFSMPDLFIYIYIEYNRNCIAMLADQQFSPMYIHVYVFSRLFYTSM